GGQNTEHEVSLMSAKNVIEALDKTKYQPVLIGIDKQGKWKLQDKAKYLLNENNPELIKLNASNTELRLSPGHGRQLESAEVHSYSGIDVVFPVLHGSLGEDGSIQGLLKLLDIPFVGPDVLGSAIGMDKDVTKRLLGQAGIAVAPFLTFRSSDKF